MSAADVALPKELDKLQAAGLGLDAAANAFADVVNAGLIPLVDACSLKQGDAVCPLSNGVRVAAVAGLAFEELGLVPRGTPVVYDSSVVATAIIICALRRGGRRRRFGRGGRRDGGARPSI